MTASEELKQQDATFACLLLLKKQKLDMFRHKALLHPLVASSPSVSLFALCCVLAELSDFRLYVDDFNCVEINAQARENLRIIGPCSESFGSHHFYCICFFVFF